MVFRLKLGNGLQYVLNAKGSSPAEVLGIDYKSTLKPALDSFADDINKSSMSKLEELISLQQQSVENAAKIEAKRNRLAALQSSSDEVSELELIFLVQQLCIYIPLMKNKKLRLFYMLLGCQQEQPDFHFVFIKILKKGKSIGDVRYRLTPEDKNFGEDDESSTHKILKDIPEYLWYK